MNTFLVNDNNGLVNYWQKYEAGFAVAPENEGNAFLVSAITSQTQTNSPLWEDYRPSTSTISGNRIEISNAMAVLLLLIVVLIIFAIVGCAYLCTYVLARIKRREPLLTEDTIPPSYDEIAKNDEKQLPSYWQVAAGGWQVAAGGWQVAAGGWQVAGGGRQVAAGGWQMAGDDKEVDKCSQLPSYWVVAAAKEDNKNPPPYCADKKDSGNPLPTYWVADGTKGDSDNSLPPYCIAAATMGVSETPLPSYWVADAIKEANENPLATCREDNNNPLATCREDNNNPVATYREDKENTLATYREDNKNPLATYREDNENTLETCREDNKNSLETCREVKQIPLPSYWLAEGNELKGVQD